MPQKTADEYRKNNMNSQISTIRVQAHDMAERIVYTYEERQKLNDMAQERFLTGQTLGDEAMLKQKKAVNELLHDQAMCDMIEEIESLQAEQGEPALYEMGRIRNRLREDFVCEIQRLVERILLRNRQRREEGDSR